VIIKDSENCKATSNYLLHEPDSIIIDHDIVPISFGKYAITLSLSGGIKPYSFHWNVAGSENKSFILNLDPGTYSVVVVDKNGCDASASFSIEDIVTSINDNNVSISAFPNPVTESLTVSISGYSLNSADIYIVNSIGKKISEVTLPLVNNEISIPVQYFSHGINHLTIISSSVVILRVRILVP
jgi:hypothetical protein